MIHVDIAQLPAITPLTMFAHVGDNRSIGLVHLIIRTDVPIGAIGFEFIHAPISDNVERRRQLIRLANSITQQGQAAFARHIDRVGGQRQRGSAR